MKSSENYLEIRHSLSIARFSTYEKITHNSAEALALYQWNLQISATLFACLAVCEVVIRNAVAEALENTYGQHWANEASFLASLPQNARTTLNSVHNPTTSLDKVIPELPFYFWQSMFTKRFDNKIWDMNFTKIFPNATPQDKATFYTDLDKLRKLRNRIAHHEPIFDRNLAENYHLILKIIRYRSYSTASWLASWENFTQLLSQKPKISPFNS